MSRARFFSPRSAHAITFAGRVLASLILVLLAAIAAYQIWVYYEVAPRTRDAHVRADVVGVTSDVSGLITEVDVSGNQPVRRGEVLFKIDPERFQIAVDKAQANLRMSQAQWLYARQEERRNQVLSGIVAQQKSQQSESNLSAAAASVKQAKAALDDAQLDLQRSIVRAPFDGIASNVNLRPGSYIRAGTAMIALVDRASVRVEGYFQETRLEHIHVGDPVQVQLLGDSHVLHGHVSSISGAINDSDTVLGSNLLPSIAPNFSWVRLAQRVPVRIHIDSLPAGVQLLPGRTATVSIVSDHSQATEPAVQPQRQTLPNPSPREPSAEAHS